MEKMNDYDQVLSDLGIMTADLSEEKLRLGGKSERERLESRSGR